MFHAARLSAIGAEDEAAPVRDANVHLLSSFSLASRLVLTGKFTKRTDRLDDAIRKSGGTHPWKRNDLA